MIGKLCRIAFALVCIWIGSLAASGSVLAQEEDATQNTVPTALDLTTMVDQNPVVAYVAALGVIIPIVTSLIVKQSWSREAKSLAWLILSVASAAGWYTIHTFQADRFVVTLTSILAASMLFYRFNNNAFDELASNRGNK